MFALYSYHRVCNKKTGPSECVCRTEQEYEADDSFACCEVAVDVEERGADCPESEAHQHPSRRCDEELSATNLVMV
jgi:hypothetical protein